MNKTIFAVVIGTIFPAVRPCKSRRCVMISRALTKAQSELKKI